jgi:hypothetical protein
LIEWHGCAERLEDKRLSADNGVNRIAGISFFTTVVSSRFPVFPSAPNLGPVRFRFDIARIKPAPQRAKPQERAASW